jgi:uncharacterized membrane protein
VQAPEKERYQVRKVWAQRDERGAILVMSTVGFVLAVICSALAVDLGTLAQERRRNQKVADLAALDAVRDIANHDVRAQQSAHNPNRNAFPTGAGYSVTSVRGRLDASRTFIADGTGNAVEVTVTSPHRNNFLPGGATVVARAVASAEERAQFSVGSNLASFSSDTSTLLNPIFSDYFDTTVNGTAVGYQGLAHSTVSLGELVAADTTLGSPSQMLSSDTNLRQLAQATLTVLSNRAAGGDAAALNAKTFLAQFVTSIDSSLVVRLGDILEFNQPSDPAVAGAQINVFDLLTTGGQQAQILNGDNVVSVPNLTLGIPGLASSTLQLTLIEPAKLSALGPARQEGGVWVTRAETAQVDIDLNTTITAGTVDLLGACVLCVDLTLPIHIGAAEAVGSLTDIRCASPVSNSQIDVLTETEAGNATAAMSLRLRAPLVDQTLPSSGNVPFGGGSETLTFTGPYPTAIQSTGGAGLNFARLLGSQLNVGSLSLSAVLALLNPVLDPIDDRILAPLFEALGLSVGNADVRGMQVSCGSDSPLLVK